VSTDRGVSSPQVRHDVSAVVSGILVRYADEPGALLPILQAVQEALGYIPTDVVPDIAQALNLSRAEVHGVISYYHDFHTEPGPAHCLAICRAEACQAMGAQALLDHARRSLGCDDNHVPTNSQFAVTAVYCLGLCASSPALALDGAVHARMTTTKLDALLSSMHQASRP